MRWRLAASCTAVGAVLAVALAVPACASTLLAAGQMNGIRGGCGSCAYADNDQMCGISCLIDLTCTSARYCDSGLLFEFCKTTRPGYKCTQYVDKTGCGEMRENGTCSGGRCTGGNRVGFTCARGRANGNPCP